MGDVVQLSDPGGAIPVGGGVDASESLRNGARAPETLVLRPARRWATLGLGELWHYRELVYFLTWRDIKVRYKQTALGIIWAVLQPLATMVVFAVFFGRLAKVPSDGLPYAIFTLSALLPWTLFSRALSDISNSLVVNSNLITKVYFPRLAIPLAGMLAALVDFAIALALFGALMPFYRVVPSMAIFALPAFVGLAVAAALGVSLWLSALNVEYRDVRYVVPFASQIWMLASPVAYSTSLVPQRWRVLYGLNPVVGIIDGFRWSLFHQAPLDWQVVAPSVVLTAIVLAGGVMYFRRMERTFADRI